MMEIVEAMVKFIENNIFLFFVICFIATAVLLYMEYKKNFSKKSSS